MTRRLTASKSFAVLAFLASAGEVLVSCTSDDFCADGSYECAPAPLASAGQSGAAGEDAVAWAGTGGSDEGGAATAGGAAGADSGSGGAGGTGDAGTSGTSGAAGSENFPDGACDPDAPVDGCTLSDDTGIYVDPATGDNAALGTRDAPLVSAAKALSIAADLGKTVYLCNAVFDEHVEATAGVVALRGGYTCPGDERGAWTYVEGERAKLRPISSGIVLAVRGANAFSASDVEVIAADAVDSGESSVAAFVVSSMDVTFTRVALQAGSGKNGANAVLEPFTLPSQESLNGNAWQLNVPGAEKECECPAGDVTRGGAAATTTAPAAAGEPDRGGGEPGTTGTCTAARPGAGGNAPLSPPGAGAEVLGRLSSDGWHPEAGVDGVHGGVGQGGGGAGFPTGGTYGGGGGGCGGCGGKGGPGGGGGGGSIALLALDSDIFLASSRLEARGGGHGGTGALGQSGQVGGDGGAGGMIPNAHCAGGDGGRGSDGAPGGGGAGGVSAAVLLLRASIGKDSTTLVAGTPGDGGIGGIPGVNDGINGVGRTELPLD